MGSGDRSSEKRKPGERSTSPGSRKSRPKTDQQKKEVAKLLKIEAVVLRDRVETVIDAVEAEAGHVGVTVMEAIGHGRQRGISHEYRGRVFESRFLPKAYLMFIVPASKAEKVLDAICDAARSGNESGDGLVWTTDVEHVRHNRTGKPLHEYVEVGYEGVGAR